jgi:hypothetical protein
MHRQSLARPIFAFENAVGKADCRVDRLHDVRA